MANFVHTCRESNKKPSKATGTGLKVFSTLFIFCNVQLFIYHLFFRLLGNFLEAAKDLRLACKIDFDDQADEWLREVTPNVSILQISF